MSFGGGKSQYTLEYIVKVVNQGGTAGINQLNTGMTNLNKTMEQTTLSHNQQLHLEKQLDVARNKRINAVETQTKAVKGLAFGLIGVTTAGAEFGGMLSMLQQVQEAQKEAQAELTEATAEYGAESKEAKDAAMELAKANRWGSMVFRNFMLSMFDMVPFLILTVNGMLKARKAADELRKANAELTAAQTALRNANVGTAASNKVLDASNITTTRSTKLRTFENKLLTTSTIASAGATKTFSAGLIPLSGVINTNVDSISRFKNGITPIPETMNKSSVATGKFVNTGLIPLGTGSLVAASNMDKTEKSAKRLAGTMRVLSIAAKILIPLVALEVAAQAYTRNWGGLNDKLNQAGLEIGKMIPQLQGVLGMIKKIGESIFAVFTGDFDKISEIWNESNKAQEKNTEISERQRKKIEELKEAYNEIRESNTEFLREIAQTEKKGERRDMIEDLGFSGKMVGKMDKWLKKFEEVHNKLNNFKNAVETMEKLNIMQKFGFDVPNQSWKNLAKNWANIFDNLGDMFEGEDVFDQFSEVLEKASKTKGPAVVKAIMAFTKENPNFMPMLAQLEPELYNSLKTLMESASGGMAEGLNTGMAKALESSNNNAMMGGYEIDENGFLRKKKGGSTDSKGGGLFGGIKTQIENFTKEAPTLIKGVSDAIRTAINETDWKAIITAFRIEVIDPIILAIPQWALAIGTELWSIMATTIEERKAQGKIKLTIPDFFEFAANEISNQPESVDKNFGPDSEAQKWVDTYINSWLEPLTDPKNWDLTHRLKNTIISKFILNPIGTIIEFIKGDGDSGISSQADEVAAGINESARIKLPTVNDILNGLGINQFFDAVGEAWRQMDTLVKNVGQGLKDFLSDPIGWFFNQVKKNSVGPNGTQKIDPNTGNRIPELPPNYIPPGTGQYKPAVFTIDSGGGELNMAQQAARMHDAVIIVFQDMVTKINQQFQHLAQVWSVIMNSLGINAESGSTQVQEHVTNMWTFVVGVFDSLASHWSSINNSFGANAKSGADQIYKALRKTFDKVINDMSAVASHWSSMCNSLINNAKAAAKGINKALDSIEDEEVVIRYRIDGSPFAKGGLMSFAGGGIMSAAGGRLLTTNGPQLFQIGDNPGGRESIWAVPHDNPGPTLAKIDRMYGRTRGGSGSMIFNGSYTLNISGNEIVNPSKIRKVIKSTVGNDMDRYGA